MLLRFNDKGFQDPFYAQQVSDGTLKVFAYLLLLEDPSPPPFLCIEEPENGLYHKLLETLANEFREHASETAEAVRRFLSRRISPISSTRWSHRKFGFWIRGGMVFQRFAVQATILS